VYDALQVALVVQQTVLDTSLIEVIVVPALAASQNWLAAQVTVVVPPHLVMSSQQQVALSQEAASDAQ
jgi:hypothetical protein